MKAPSRSVICAWVKNSWDSIPSDTVKNSFKSCAITTALDGSEDSSIHCFKEGQPCGREKDVLAERMANLDLPMEATVISVIRLLQMMMKRKWRIMRCVLRLMMPVMTYQWLMYSETQDSEQLIIHTVTSYTQYQTIVQVFIVINNYYNNT